MKNKVQFQSGEDDSFSSIEGTGVNHQVLSLSRRFIALLGLLLAFGLMPYMAFADDAVTLSAQINSFIHGGVGTLSATYAGDEVTVTGTVTGATATLPLTIDANVTVKWGADYSGSTAANIALVNNLGTGDFEVITGGKIEQTGTGNAFFTNSTIIVSGGTVSATTGWTIFGSNVATVIVTSGSVTTTTGFAIEAANVTVSGTGEVSGSDNSIFIAHVIIAADYVEVKDNAKVSAISGYVITAYGTNSTVIISGNAKVLRTDVNTNCSAIESNGNVEVKDNAEVDGAAFGAINTFGASSSVIVSGGTVSSIGVNGATIEAQGDVTVSGTGVVKATDDGIIGGRAINVAGNVKVKDNAIVSATTGYAINASGAPGTFDVSGGFVFAYGIGIADVFSSGYSPPTGTGVVVAWDEAQGNTDYISGSETDLTIFPGNGARWALNGTSSGIGYGSNGFFEIAGVNVYVVYQVYFNVTGANGTLTASVDNAGIVSGDVVLSGKNVVFTATPASNYRVKEWTLNGVPVSGNTTNSFTLSNIAAAAIVTVEFEEIPVITTTYNLNIGTFSGGSVISNKYIYMENESVNLTIIPDSGFELYTISAYRTGVSNVFVSLSGSGNSRTFTMPAYDVTVTATFRNTSYQSMWNAALPIIENADLSIMQQKANTLTELRYRLADLINELIKGTGFVISSNDIVIFDFNFLPATAGDSGNPSGTNGYFEFRITPPNINKSAYNSGIITATAYDPTGNDLIVAREDSQTLRVWTQNSKLHVSGLTPGITWRVYSLSGVLVYQRVATNEKAEVQLPVRGVYVVTNGKKTLKVVISD